MAIVAGVDFGTLSVRVSLVDSERGLIDSAIAEYPLHRKREDPEYATQSHDDHMRALAAATREVLKKTGIAGDQVQAIALDTTGSSVIPVGKDLQPLGEYYLWCDHRAKGEAAEITEAAHREKSGSHQVVRRRLFLGVGIFQAAALAPAQPRKAIAVCVRIRALRHGGGHARAASPIPEK